MDLDIFYDWSMFGKDGKFNESLNKVNQNEAFLLFMDLYNHHCGSVVIDENLIEIHTGGWSDNEEIISYFRKTRWWEQNIVFTRHGGHYYFDTSAMSEGKKEWVIIKSE